jgi:transposase
MTRAHELCTDVHDAYVVGDSAYSSRALVDELEARGCKVTIDSNPTHRPRSIDRDTYRERFLVEHFFQRIKRFRRISMRFEKLARNFLSFVYLAASLVWLA